MTLTDADLAVIAARAEAATPGPWTDHATGSEGATVLQTNPPPRTLGRIARLFDSEVRQATADAAFIAHARTDIPALLAEVARLRREAGEREEDGDGR